MQKKRAKAPDVSENEQTSNHVTVRKSLNVIVFGAHRGRSRGRSSGIIQ